MAAIVMFLITAAVALFLVGGLVVIVAIGSMTKDEKRRARAVENAESILDEAFRGDSVTYESTPRTLPFEDVVAGGIARGYALAGQTENPGNRKVLVFTKVNSESRTA